MSSARAAINAALEAARSASRGQGGGQKRPTAMSIQADQNAAQAAAPAPAPAPAAPPPAMQAAPAAPPPVAKAPPPWEQPSAPPAAPVQQQPQAVQHSYDEPEADDGPPSWVMEFSDDTAVAQEAPAATVAPAAVRAPAAPRHAYVITPVPEIDWDGNWPGLAAGLPLRGVAQQLAFQTELVNCTVDGNVTTFKLRVPIDTLRASGNSEKLAAALQERFTNTKVAVDIDIGHVWYTASAEAQAFREECQRKAEETVASDPFVKDLMREFGAFVVQGSIRPPPATAA